MRKVYLHNDQKGCCVPQQKGSQEKTHLEHCQCPIKQWKQKIWGKLMLGDLLGLNFYSIGSKIILKFSIHFSNQMPLKISKSVKRFVLQIDWYFENGRNLSVGWVSLLFNLQVSIFYRQGKNKLPCNFLMNFSCSNLHFHRCQQTQQSHP